MPVFRVRIRALGIIRKYVRRVVIGVYSKADQLDVLPPSELFKSPLEPLQICGLDRASRRTACEDEIPNPGLSIELIGPKFLPRLVRERKRWQRGKDRQIQTLLVGCLQLRRCRFGCRIACLITCGP